MVDAKQIRSRADFERLSSDERALLWGFELFNITSRIDVADLLTQRDNDVLEIYIERLDDYYD